MKNLSSECASSDPSWLRHFWQKQHQNCTTAVLSLGLGAVLLTAGAAQAQRIANESYPAVLAAQGRGGEARIEVLGQFYTQLPAVASHQGRIVLYRLEDGREGATGVFVNERYHTTLVPGAWSQLCYNSGAVQLATRQVQAANAPAKDRYDAISAVSIQPGQVNYLRVDMSANLAVLRPVTSAQALQEIGRTREQLHTVSRVAEFCIDTPSPSPAPAPALSTAYTLSADTLFAFDRSDRASMTHAGTVAIDQLLARVRSDYSRIDSINLVGHADPLGQLARNERLSVERAQTVRNYILQTAQWQAPVTAEGRGSREPVVTTCGDAPTPQAIACNLPNRRVTVEVMGVRR